METKKNTRKERKGGDKQGIIIRILLLIICLLMITFCFAFCRNNSVPENGTSTTESTWTPDIDGDATDYVTKPEQNKTSTGTNGIKITGFGRMNVKSGQTEDIYAGLQNPEGNNCYFVFIIKLDSGETLYTSKMVPPGQSINYITFSQPLDSGSYNAVINIKTYQLDTGNELNGANLKVIINVK